MTINGSMIFSLLTNLNYQLLEVRGGNKNNSSSIPSEDERDQGDDDDDDDDVVESTASAFDRAKRDKSRGSRRGPFVVDLDSGCTTKVSKNPSQDQSDQANDELNDSRKSNKAVVAPVEEPKFNCPICLGPFTEEMSTKCGHIFCKSCIKDAISRQANCPTCRKKVTAKGLIRVFLPTTE
ncbi:RING/U-box superfamily protein [Raphanus sativus]|nr:PREDICTED: LON peptidase N-terminal domain and RING finger protein 3-like [Raphanus sativus]KAJ4886049.1 RING/U-box superfamily protein [Raphanus sativus]